MAQAPSLEGPCILRHKPEVSGTRFRLGSGFGVPYSKGDLTGYSPAACRAYRAAHSCLWD